MKPCDRWRESLAEFALGQSATSELSEHLEKCADCSRTLAKMQSLTGELDRGIRQLASAEPQADGAARILMETRSRVEHTRWMPAGRTIAAVVAATVFLAASLGALWRLRAQREETANTLSAAAAISGWRSPTRELLHSPYSGLLKSAPRLGETFYRLDTPNLKTDDAARSAKEKLKP